MCITIINRLLLLLLMQRLCAAATIAARMLLLLLLLWWWLLLLLLMMHEAAAGLRLCMRTLLNRWWRHWQCHCRCLHWSRLGTLILAIRYGDHITHHTSWRWCIVYGDRRLLHMWLMMCMQWRLAAATTTTTAAVIGATTHSRAASTAILHHNMMTR